MTDQSILQQSPQGSPFYIEEDPIALTDFLLILARNLKLLIITPLVLGFITALYVSFIAQPVYVSWARIISSDSRYDNISFLQTQGIARALGGSAAQLPFVNEYVWVYPEIIKSRPLARILLMKKFDTDEFGPQKSLLQILTYGNDEPEFSPDILMKIGIKTLHQKINISQKNNIYTISVSASEPKLAADICKNLIEVLDQHQNNYNTEKARDTRIFIEGRIIEAQKELEEVEEELKIFRDSNRQILESPALLLEEQRLTRETSVLTSVFTTLKQQLEITKIEEVKESTLVQIIDPPEAPLKKNKPNRILSVILSLILGFVMALVVAFVREYTRNRNEEEKGKLREIKKLTRNSISDLLPFRRKKQF